jgi:hypothetical protein
MEHPALAAAALGYHVAIVRKGEKAALHRNFPERHLCVGELEWYLRRDFNWGFVLRGLVVADVDGTGEELDAWLRERGIVSRMEIRTRRGVHRYFRLPELAGEVRSRMHAAGLPVDLLTGNRLAIGPGSVVNGFRYAVREGCAIVAPETLPVFPAEALLAPPERPVVLPLVGRNIESVRKYCARIVAVSGQGGHNATYRAACRFADAGLTEEEVLAELIAWNETNAEPKWSLSELRHKAHDAVYRRQ